MLFFLLGAVSALVLLAVFAWVYARKHNFLTKGDKKK